MFLLEFNLALTHKHPFASTSNHFIKSNFINFFKEFTFSMLHNAIIAKYLQTVLTNRYYLANSSTKIYIFFVKIKNQAWFILVRSKSICSKVTKILHWYNFLTKRFCVQRSIYFYNSMIKKNYGPYSNMLFKPICYLCWFYLFNIQKVTDQLG